VIDLDEILKRLDEVEVKQEIVEDPLRRELLDKAFQAAEDARRHAELALKLVGRTPPTR
jgi:hypothetical protein